MVWIDLGFFAAGIRLTARLVGDDVEALLGRSQLALTLLLSVVFGRPHVALHGETVDVVDVVEVVDVVDDGLEAEVVDVYIHPVMLVCWQSCLESTRAFHCSIGTSQKCFLALNT